MKILVATKRGQGKRSNDFSWTTEGEIVTFSSECDREEVDGHCGCRRSMSGVDSHKATTTMVCEERAMDGVGLTHILKRSGDAGGWNFSLSECNDMANELMEVAGKFHVGDVVERRGDVFQTRKGGMKC